MARHQLAAIVESSEDAIIGKDLSGTITSWNRGAERLYGYSEDEIVGKSKAVLIPSDHPDELPGILNRIRSGVRVEPYETQRVRKGGSLVDVSITVSPVLNEAGEIMGAATIARDISERKKVEAALREADRRKTEFLATLAHELRNPLAPLSNALEALKLADADSARAARFRTLMERQLQHLVRLVDDLLDVSRITSGKIQLRKERVELVAVVHSALETSRPLIEQFGHELAVSLPEAPLYLHADVVRLAQVFANLLNNAAKYTDKGGRIALRARREGDSVVVEATDTGIGIPGEALPDIFEMFTQVDRSLERAHGGLGIGLSLVRGLVQLHGGSVAVHSAGPGQGSTFTVRLPLAGDSVSASPTGRPAAASAPLRHRILVVDDNRDSADSLATLLAFKGHEVRTAYDGNAAVQEAASYRPDAMLLDIGLPGLNGYEAARKIREAPWSSDTVLIATTGWGHEDDKQRAREAGFDFHLTKPVNLEALEALLAKVRPARVEAAQADSG